jgi:single-strand DNA-binding protein
MATINRVVIVGNLTRDPELRSTANGTSVCRMRIACSTSWRNRDTGELDQRPNYFDVSVFGASGEACARFLAKGRPVAVDGRLEWHEWTTPEGEQRQAVGIQADSVQFLAARQRAEEGEEELAEAEEPAIAF